MAKNLFAKAADFILNGMRLRGSRVHVRGDNRVYVDGSLAGRFSASGDMVGGDYTGELVKTTVQVKLTVLSGTLQELVVTGDVDVAPEVQVRGSIDAVGSVTCGAVGGDVDATGNVTCGNVGGSVDAMGNVTCGTIGGDVDAMGNVRFSK